MEVEGRSNDMNVNDESEKEIVRIQVANESLSVKPSLQLKEKVKKYKIRLDPNILVDDDMHGGIELINSTILKSESGKDQSSNQEEAIEKEMSVDRNEESNTKVVINTTSSLPQIENNIVKKPNTILETDCFLSSKYIRVLDKLINTEVKILEKEARDFELKWEEQVKTKVKVYKKNFNFIYLFQKRLKRKISSRKFKYMSLEKEEDQGIVKCLNYKGDGEPAKDEQINSIYISPMRKSVFSKLPGTSNLAKKALSVSLPTRNSKKRKYLKKISESPHSLDKVEEEHEENYEAININQCKSIAKY